MEPIFFETAEEFRAWLAEHHESEKEAWVGFYKVGSGHPSITYPDAVEQALCFGWIDGVRRGLDQQRYVNRFTPRKPGSYWSLVNVERVRKLMEQRLMTPAGLRAFEARQDEKTGNYSYEPRSRPIDPAYEERLRANPNAWAFFSKQAPWYQRAAGWWVMSAKKPETQLRRLATLIDDSAQGRRVGPLAGPRSSRSEPA